MENKIKMLRTYIGMTQQELATKVEVSARTIISLEKGDYNPSVILAYKLAKTFGKTIEEIFIFE